MLAALHQESEPERSAFYYRRLLATDSCAEDAYHALIVMALAAGRRGEALRRYRQYTDNVWRELAYRPNQAIEGIVRIAGLSS